MRLRFESDCNLDALTALKYAWQEYVASDPDQPMPDPRHGNTQTHRINRTTARAMLAAADAGQLTLKQHKLTEDGVDPPTVEPMTFVPEAFGWTRAELEAEEP